MLRASRQGMTSLDGPVRKDLPASRRSSAFRVERAVCYLAFVTGFFGVALFPFDLGPFQLFPYRLFLILLWGLLGARALSEGTISFGWMRPIKPFMAFLGFWVVYAFISLGWVASLGMAIRHVIFLLMGTSMIVLAASRFQEERDHHRLFWIWLGVLSVMIVVGFWEHLTGHHLPSSGYFEETRLVFMYLPTGVFGNPNNYASYLALSIPFGLSLARYSRKLFLRVGGIAAVLASGYLILAAGSRGNLVAVLVALAFLWLFLVRRSRKVAWIVVVALAIGTALLVVPRLVSPVLDSAADEISSLLRDVPLEQASIQIRWNLIRNSMNFVFDTAGFGVGAGNAEYWMANFSRYETFGILNLHNWWLELLTDYGLLVFGAYVVFYLSLVRALWREWKRTADRRQRMVCEALLLSLVTFSIASMSPSSVMAFAPHWLLIAFSLAFLRTRRMVESVS